MSRTVDRPLCVLLVCLLVLSGFFVLAGNGAAPTASGAPSTVPAAQPQADPAAADDRSWEGKLDSAIRESVLRGSKESLEVVVFSTDVPELARVMQAFPYEGLLGTNAKKVDFPVAVYLKTPAFAVRDIGKMDSTLFVLQEGRLKPDVVEASPEVLGGNLAESPKLRTYTAEEIRALKLGLPEAQETPDVQATVEPEAVDPGPNPEDTFNRGIHRAVQANANGFRGGGVKVAIIDTGVDFGHPDLQGTWALFDVSTVPASILTAKPYLAEYDGWPLALNPDGILDYLRNEGRASNSHGFSTTDAVLPAVISGPDTVVRWNRDSPLVTPLNFLGLPMDGAHQGTGFPAVFFNPAEPVTPVPFRVPAGTVQMNIEVAFPTCVDLDAALVYDSDNDGTPELGELVSWEETATGAEPEVFPAVQSPATANEWFVLILAFDATACTADVFINFISITTQLATYNITGIASMSGGYHVAKFWDDRLISEYFMRPGVLVVDSASPGFYDTVYVDLDNDFSFTNEMAIRRGSPVAYKDLDGDTWSDVSSGAVVHVSNAGTKTGVPAIEGTTWAQLPDENIVVNRLPAVYRNGVPFPNMTVINNEVLTVSAGSRNLQLDFGGVGEGSVVLRGTDIQVLDESTLEIRDTATDTNFTTRNSGLLDLSVYRERTSPLWYGPTFVKLTQGQDYTVSLATGLVTFLPRIISNPNPFIANLNGDRFRVWYNYTGTVSTEDYAVNLAGSIAMQYPLKATSMVTADYVYEAWTFDPLTGNLTFAAPLGPGDQITADYQFGVTPLPYSDVIAERLGADNWYWGSGDLVMFTGAPLAYGGPTWHGTSVATMIAGQGRMNVVRDDLGTLQPGTPRFHGMAPDAKIIAIPTTLAFSAIAESWYFAVEGYDGVPVTGDEAQILSNSWGTDPYLGSGLGFVERFGDWLMTNYSRGTASLVKSAGNPGYGYGMGSDEGTPGLITVGATGSWYYRSTPEFICCTAVHDRGPNPSYGDVADFSAWGPYSNGQIGVDIAFTGEFVYGARPVNDFLDGTAAWDITSGTSFSAPLASGALALIYSAYRQAHGVYPDTFKAKELLLSGADRMNHDVFTVGAGFGNALRSTDLAAGRGGIRASPYAWYPGDYRGVDYPASLHLLGRGETDTGSIGLINEGPTATTVSIGATEYLRADTASYAFTPSIGLPLMDTGHNWTLITPDGKVRDWFGRVMASFDPALWSNSDVIRVTGYYSHDTFEAAPPRTIFLEPFDWTDTTPNGRFWGLSSNVTSVDYCADGSIFVTGSADNKITVWNGMTGLPIRQFGSAPFPAGIGDVPGINDIDLSPDCSLVAVATGVIPFGAGRAAVFDVATGTLLWRRAADAIFAEAVSSVEFSPDGTMLAYASYFNGAWRVLNSLPPTDTTLLPDVVVRDVATAAIVSRAAGHKDVVNDIAWSADSSMIMTGASDTPWLTDNSAIVFDISVGDPASIVAAFAGHQDRRLIGPGAPEGVKAVALHSDGVHAISVGQEGTVRVWDMSVAPTTHVTIYTAAGTETPATPIALNNPFVVPLSYSVLRNAAPVNEFNGFTGAGDYRVFQNIGQLRWFGGDTGPLVAGDVLTITYDFAPPVQSLAQTFPDSIAETASGMVIGSSRAENVVGYSGTPPTFATAFTVTPTWDRDGVVSVGTTGANFFMGSRGGELSVRGPATGTLVNLGTDPVTGFAHNPFGLTGFIFERNRMGVYIAAENAIEMRIRNPDARTHDGLAIWWRHLGGPPVNTPVTIQIEFFNRQPWSWISGLPAGPQTIGAGGTLALAPTVTVPSNAGIGLYEGQIEVDDGGNITTIPVVVNVAFRGSSVFSFGGNVDGKVRLYNNWELRSYEAGSAAFPGDVRFFYFDLPDGFALSQGQKWTVDFSFTGADSYAVPRHAGLVEEQRFGGVLVGRTNASRYGPIVLEETDVDAPGFFKKSVDWQGRGNGVFRALSVGGGLNLLAVHGRVLNGSTASETFAGTTGIMSVTPNPILVSTNQLQSSVAMSLSTTTAWEASPDPFDPSYGKAMSVATSQVASTLTEDLPVADYCPSGDRSPGGCPLPGTTFQDYLFGAPNKFVTEVPVGTLAASWMMFFHSGARDVDYGLWYDEDCDGVYAIEDDVGGSDAATAGNPERLDLSLPRAGCYVLHAAGFDVDPGGALYDLTFALTVFGVSAFVPQGVPTATIAAGTSAQFELAWSFDAGRAEGVTSEVLFISPGNAPFSLAQLVTLTFSYDVTPPGFSAHVPAPGSVTTDSSPSIFVQVDDTQPGALERRGEIDERSIRVWLDGADITSQAFVSVPFQAPGSDLGLYGYSVGVVLFTPAQPLSDGRHTMRADAADFAGNLATTSWDFFVDTTGPPLEITSPPPGFATSATTITLEGRSESGVALTIAGQAVAVAADGTFAVDVSLVAGVNSIEVRAVDEVGNVASMTIVVRQDAAAPAFSALRSSAGLLTNAGLTVISGTVSEPVSLSVAGIEVAVRADGTFDVPVSLIEGANAIQLVAVDGAGNQATSTITVTRDGTPPTLAMDALPSETSSPTVTVTGAVESGISFVTVNGQPVVVSGGAFSQQVALSFGANVIFVEATDAAGNRASVSAAVSYVPTGVTTSAIGLILLPVLAVIALLVGLALGQAMQGRRMPPGKEGMPPGEETPPEEAPPPVEEELPPKEEEL